MRRPPRPTRLRPRQVPENVCAWCGRVIAKGREVIGFGAKAAPEVDLRSHQGRIIRLDLVAVERTVVAIVTSASSPARREGHDLYFMVCGEACGASLRAALTEEIRIGRMLRSLSE